MNKTLTIFIILLPSFLFGQTIYEHDLSESRMSELKENIRHLSKKPERWTYDSDQDFTEAITKFEQESGNGSSSEGGTGSGNGNSSYDKEKGYESPEFEQSVEPNETDFNFDMPKLSLGPLGQVLLYIFLGGILAALIYFLFINSNYKKNGAKYVALNLDETSPADIPLTELERLLEEALNNKDYRKAIRIYYLFILKDLTEKQWITWEKQKTNMHYLLEIQGKTEADSFGKVLTYFEFIWYGKRNISKAQFLSIQPVFTQLLTALNIK